MTDHALWDAILGYTWEERVRMAYLRECKPHLLPPPCDESIDFHLVGPAVAGPLAGDFIAITWHGAPDRPVDVG